MLLTSTGDGAIAGLMLSIKPSAAGKLKKPTRSRNAATTVGERDKPAEQ